MLYLAGERQSGRTSLLIEWAAREMPGDPPRYLVASNKSEADWIKRTSEIHLSRMGIDQDLRPVLTPSTLMRRGGEPGAEVAIDNLEHVLSAIIPRHLTVKWASIDSSTIHRIL